MVTTAVPATLIPCLCYYRSSLRCSVCPFSSPSHLRESPAHTRRHSLCSALRCPCPLLHYLLSGSGPLPPVLRVVPCTTVTLTFVPYSGNMTDPMLPCTFHFQLRCYQLYPVRIPSLAAFCNPYLSPSSSWVRNGFAFVY